MKNVLIYISKSSTHQLLENDHLTGTMCDSTAPSRKALKAALSLSTPAGEEQAVLKSAEAELQAAQDAVRALRQARSRNEREISVRKRKIADWKGKIPFAGTPSLQSAQLALHRASTMPWHVIADASPSSLTGSDTTLTFRKPFRRALSGLQGFSHIWLLTVRSNVVFANVHAIDVVDVRSGTVQLTDESDRCGMIVDVKPYLQYCDAVTQI